MVVTFSFNISGAPVYGTGAPSGRPTAGQHHHNDANHSHASWHRAHCPSTQPSSHDLTRGQGRWKYSGVTATDH